MCVPVPIVAIVPSSPIVTNLQCVNIVPDPGYQMIGAYLGVTTASIYVYYLTWKEIYRDEIEMKSGRFALSAMLQAERDREYLKQLRRNRDEETALMANVEGWKVNFYRFDLLFGG